MYKTFEGYRIVLEVDQQWFEAIAKMTCYTDYGDVMNWISSDRIEITREECDICSTLADETGYLGHDDDAHEQAEEEEEV
jgi:hypothetical protein